MILWLANGMSNKQKIPNTLTNDCTLFILAFMGIGELKGKKHNKLRNKHVISDKYPTNIINEWRPNERGQWKYTIFNENLFAVQF